jgi:hypothetical protein
MPQELNWCGQPIAPGGCYGGKPEHISGTRQKVTTAKQQGKKLPTRADEVIEHKSKHYEVITEKNVAEVFGNGAYKLPRAEAAKRLELSTNAHRTSCYRALRLKGRFGGHLYSDGTTLSWRSL